MKVSEEVKKGSKHKDFQWEKGEMTKVEGMRR